MRGFTRCAIGAEGALQKKMPVNDNEMVLNLESRAYKAGAFALGTGATVSANSGSIRLRRDGADAVEGVVLEGI